MIQRQRRRFASCLSIWLLIQCHGATTVWSWQQPPSNFFQVVSRTRSSSVSTKSRCQQQLQVQRTTSALHHHHDDPRNRRLSFSIAPPAVHSRILSHSRRPKNIHPSYHHLHRPASRTGRSTTAIRQSDHADDEREPSTQINHHHRRSIVRTPVLSSLVSRLRRRNGKSAAPTTKEVVDVERMQRENLLLRGALQRLEMENERLHRNMASSIVLESFEGEGALWNPNKSNRTIDVDGGVDNVNGGGTVSTDDGPFMVTSNTMTSEELLAQEAAIWCDPENSDDDTCPVEPDVSFGEALRDRAYWLVGLLILQSLSGIILARNEALLQHHPFIVYFLTMLVGAGGNAGNQASVRVIRGLALGTLNDVTQTRFLAREFKMAMALSSILSVAGFVRAAAFSTPFPETIALTMALFLIVFTSVCLGAVLPIGLKRIGIDPAHSSTTIQVIMDILGVVLAVVVSGLLLDSPVGHMIISRLGG